MIKPDEQSVLFCGDSCVRNVVKHRNLRRFACLLSDSDIREKFLGNDAKSLPYFAEYA